MDQQKKMQPRRTRSGGDPAASTSPGDAGPSRTSLLDQARAWGAAAREAYESCEKGADAEAELRLRRNRSGQ
jgi:hypothetical protein